MSEPAPPTDGDTSATRASVTAVVGVLGAVALLLLLVTWAASIGPQQVVTDPGNPPTNFSAPTTTASAAEDAGSSDARPRGGGDHDVLFTVVAVVATVLAAVVMLAALLTVIRWLLTRSWWRRREPEPDEVAFDPLEAPALLAEALAAGASGQRQSLEKGSPRNGIVECWHRFEELAGSVGVRRHPWETSSEFTMRLLDQVSADHRAVGRLAELYRDARYSDHEVSEETRREAAAALDVIHDSVGRVRSR
jgi:hypothetical protein